MIILSIVALVFVLIALVWAAHRKANNYPGFSSKARAAAWSGEMKSSDVRDMVKSIEIDAQNKAKK